MRSGQGPSSIGSRLHGSTAVPSSTDMGFGAIVPGELATGRLLMGVLQ